MLFFLYLKEINQPNSRYVKIPGTTFPDELPINNPIPTRILCFNEANKFLEYDRKIHPILGDGNCLFGAISYLMFWQEDYHQQIRNFLMDFIIFNRDVFCKYCIERPLEEHVAHMKYDTIWGTDIEIRAVASCLQICAHKEVNHWTIIGIALLH